MSFFMFPQPYPWECDAGHEVEGSKTHNLYSWYRPECKWLLVCDEHKPKFSAEGEK